MLIKDQLALRIAALDDDTKYQQKPAYNKAQRLFGAVRYEPGFLKKGSARTIIKADIEWGNVDSNSPRQLPPLDGITPWFQTGTYAPIAATGNQFTQIEPLLKKLESGSTLASQTITVAPVLVKTP